MFDRDWEEMLGTIDDDKENTEFVDYCAHCGEEINRDDDCVGFCFEGKKYLICLDCIRKMGARKLLSLLEITVWDGDGESVGRDLDIID